MTDTFANFAPALSSPASNGFAVTPSDTTDLTNCPRSLYVGGSGDIQVLLLGDSNPVTLTSVNAGSILPIRVRRVYATNTTATGIVALY